jgi:hypothetical protein
MNASDVIDVLPAELGALLEADPFFVDIPIVVADKGNIRVEMERKQAVITKKNGHRGVAVIVLQLVGDDTSQSDPSVRMKFKPAFQIVENVELNNDPNGTAKSHRKVALKICLALKLVSLGGIVSNITMGSPAIEPVQMEKEIADFVVASQVNCECYAADNENVSRVNVPTFTVLAGPPRVQIDCSTAGADIYFTTDETQPNGTPADTTAILYAAPIAVPDDGNLIVRARAFLNGQQPSSIPRITISP